MVLHWKYSHINLILLGRLTYQKAFALQPIDNVEDLSEKNTSAIRSHSTYFIKLYPFKYQFAGKLLLNLHVVQHTGLVVEYGLI